MRKLSVTVAVGLIVALVGGGLVFAYGRSVDQRIADGKKTVDVLVALKALAAGTPSIALDKDTQLRKIPQAYLPEGFIKDLNEVAGQVLVGPLPAGASLNRTHFGSPATVGAVEPTEGNVALAVQVGISPGVARYVRVGSFVDVFVTYSGTGGGVGLGQQGKPSQSENRTKLFVTGVKVLAVSIAEPRVEEQTEGGSGNQNRQAQSRESGSSQVIAILDVDPITAERIVNAVSIGELYLALSKQNAGHKTPTGVVPDDVVTSNR